MNPIDVVAAILIVFSALLAIGSLLALLPIAAERADRAHKAGEAAPVSQPFPTPGNLGLKAGTAQFRALP